MIIVIRCAPGRKVMFSDGRRRAWDGPVDVTHEFPKRERKKFERMCHLLRFFRIAYVTEEEGAPRRARVRYTVMCAGSGTEGIRPVRRTSCLAPVAQKMASVERFNVACGAADLP